MAHDTHGIGVILCMNHASVQLVILLKVSISQTEFKEHAMLMYTRPNMTALTHIPECCCMWSNRRDQSTVISTSLPSFSRHISPCSPSSCCLVSTKWTASAPRRVTLTTSYPPSWWDGQTGKQTREGTGQRMRTKDWRIKFALQKSLDYMTVFWCFPHLPSVIWLPGYKVN